MTNTCLVISNNYKKYERYCCTTKYNSNKDNSLVEIFPIFFSCVYTKFLLLMFYSS